jgi:CheY-like chemotaxis protein
MPEMNGLDATIEILRRAREEGVTPPRIFALTANAFWEDRERCIAAGMNGYISESISSQLIVRNAAAYGAG